MKNKKLLPKISIRARFAIAIICMKRAFREANLHQTYEAHVIAEKLATLLTRDKLGVWETEMNAYILSGEFKKAEDIISFLRERNNDYKNRTKIDDRLGYYKDVKLEILNEEFYHSLIEFYAKMDEETKESIYLCENVAGNNLYCGYCECSSIEPLIELLDKTEMWGNFDFYNIAQNYPFSHDNIWGKKFKFSEFRRS